MDCNTDRVFASLNLEEELNNYKTWKYLTEGKLISWLTSLNVDLLNIIQVYLNVCKQMTDVKCYIATLKSFNWVQTNEEK